MPYKPFPYRRSMLTAPCMNCGERSAECHGSCERYRAFTEENKRLREQSHEERNIERTHTQSMMKSAEYYRKATTKR